MTSTIQLDAARVDLSPAPRHRATDSSWTDARKAHVAKRWSEGLPAWQIADELGDIGTSAVSQLIRDMGLQAREHSRWTREVQIDLIARHCRGETPAEIRAAYGSDWTRSMIIGKLHRIGVIGIHDVETCAKLLSEHWKRLEAPTLALPSPKRPPTPPHNQVSLRAFNAPPAEDADALAWAQALREEGLSGERPTVLALRPCQCRWPLGDTPRGRMDEVQFCGKPAPLMGQPGVPPYCVEHSRISGNPSATRRVDKQLKAPKPLMVRRGRRFHGGGE